MAQPYPSPARSGAGAFYLRTAGAIVLIGLALLCADKIVARLHAMPVLWLLLLGPALLIALAIEVAVSDHAASVYNWRTLGSEAAGAVIGVIAALWAAIRIGEPVIDEPGPWLVIAAAVIPFAAAIGYARSGLFAPPENPPA